MFSGKAGAGKSYSAAVAKEICDKAGLNSKIVSFASGVKYTATMVGWDGIKDQKGTLLLQDVGKAGRKYDPDMWVRNTFNAIENMDAYPFDVVFIDDWRFNNEYSYIINNQPLYKVIDIRIKAPSRERLKGTPAYEDVSETELDSFKFTPTNHVWNEPDYLFYRGCIEDIVFRSFVQYSKT